jgi:spore germination protein KC
MKKYILIIIFCLLPALFTGCWSRREVEELAIVGGMAIDKGQGEDRGKYLVTLNILRPGQISGGAGVGMGGGGGGGGGGARPTWQIIAQGETIFEAARNVSLRAPRELFFGHTRYIVISEDVAREGLHKILDLLYRSPEIRLRAFIVVTGGSALELVRGVPELEHTISRAMEGIAKTSRRENSKFEMVDVKKVTEKMIAPGIDPVIGRVELIQARPQVDINQIIKTIIYRGGAVIRKDRMAGWLDEREMRGYMLGAGLARGGIFPVKIHHGKADVSIEMTRASSRFKIKSEGGRLKVKIEVFVEGDLGEHQGLEEIAVAEKIPELEKKFNAALRSEIMAAIKKAQTLKSDIFGFGQALERSDPKLFKELRKDWPEHFAGAEVTLDIKAHVRRTGLISNTPVPE